MTNRYKIALSVAVWLSGLLFSVVLQAEYERVRGQSDDMSFVRTSLGAKFSRNSVIWLTKIFFFCDMVDCFLPYNMFLIPYIPKNLPYHKSIFFDK